MLELDSLRQVLYAKAIAATTASNFLCQIGDEPFTPPTDGTLYGEFWFRTAPPRQMELGGATSTMCRIGLLQFTIYAPEKTGDGPAYKLGDALAKAFTVKQWQVPPDGYVQIEPAAATPLPGIHNGKKVVIVDAAFDFYYSDPLATNT